MIVICSSCSTRLQVDEAKLPARPFTIRCPKCQNIINGQPPTSEQPDQSALGLSSPALESVRYKQPKAAPAYRLETEEEAEEIKQPTPPPPADANDLVRLLAELLQRGVPAAQKDAPGAGGLLSWERKRALVCLTPARREILARLLAENDYEVYVAEDTSQAIERMREEQMQVVLLESEFDAMEKGAAFVTREVNALRPAQRRRLLFVHLSPTARTLDTHAAFVQNVNLVVNIADLDFLPHALERATREYKELYRDFNAALNVASF